jgi:hypothetical protein
MQLVRIVQIGILAIGVSLAPAQVGAVSIGTASLVALDDATASDADADASAASLTARGARVAAAAFFGSGQVALAAAPGHTTHAAALWADSFTLTGGVGSAALSFHLDLEGVLAAEASTGGFARVVLRAIVGLDPVDPIDDTELGPNVVLAAADLQLSSEAGFSANTLRLDASVDYDAPFTFFVTLEALAENGAWVHFADTARLIGVDLPGGATLTGASGHDYDFGAVALSSMSAVPEPGTLALVALGTAALAGSGARRRN